MADLYSIKKETLDACADAIRYKTDMSGDIRGADFPKDIWYIDRLQRFIRDTNEFTNGYYGYSAAAIAASYKVALQAGTDDFVYSSEGGIFANNTSSTKNVRNSSGKAIIDCSTFVGLVLRGIPYDKSPYAKHKGASATWTPSSELSSMYGSEGWEFKNFDRQLKYAFSSIGFASYTTIRNAAQLAEYFYQTGMVIFDGRNDGAPSPSLSAMLRPGDLIFWSKPTGTETQKKRFRSITHVAIVAYRPTRYFQVTNGSPVVQYSQFASHYENVSMIIRPDYRLKRPSYAVPKNKNLLTYPWAFSTGTWTNKGVTFTPTGMNTIRVNGTPTESMSPKLRGRSDDAQDKLFLTKGTYKVSLTGSGVSSTGFAIQIRKSNGDDFDTPIRGYYGHDDTFTVTGDTEVIALLRISDSVGAISNKTITVSLVKTSDDLVDDGWTGNALYGELIRPSTSVDNIGDDTPESGGESTETGGDAGGTDDPTTPSEPEEQDDITLSGGVLTINNTVEVPTLSGGVLTFAS